MAKGDLRKQDQQELTKGLTLDKENLDSFIPILDSKIKQKIAKVQVVRYKLLE